MRNMSLVLAIVLAAGAGAVATATPAFSMVPHRHGGAGAAVSFYAALAPFGAWVGLEPYGNVWVPDAVPAGWRPYTEGQWAWTDEGWTWDSDFDWGWAPFHYGRWVYDDLWGWVWVPGDVWGPGWVSWSFGDDFIGWAPLPPAAAWVAGVGLGDFDFDVIPIFSWVFIDQGDFALGRFRNHLFPADRDDFYFHRARRLPGVEYADGRVFDHGIEARRLEELTHHPIEQYRLAEGRNERSKFVGHELRVYRPGVQFDARADLGRINQREGGRAELMRRQVESRRELLARQNEERQRMEQRHQRELQGAPQEGLEAMRRNHEAERRQLAERHQQARQQQLASYNRELRARRMMPRGEFHRRSMGERHFLMAQRGGGYGMHGAPHAAAHRG